MVENNIERLDRWLLRDRTNHDNWIRVYDDISKVVNDILSKRAQLAIVSRNPSKAFDGNEWSIIHLVQYNEVVDESKVEHFRRIQGWSGSDYSDMILYDDEAFNNSTRIELGVTFQFVRSGEGLMWDVYQQGLDAWRRAKNITIPPNPGSAPNRVLIGYSGLSNAWIDLVRRGEGLVDDKTPARWGYALYVADTIGLAKYFCDWDRADWGRESYVCEVWVRDYDAWTKMNKIWVPENYRYNQQMDNMGWPPEATGRNQENRDRFIADHWKIQTPYVLFSRHHYMTNMPIQQYKRWTEMVVSTQIQRSLFEVIPLSDDQVAQHPNPTPYPFHHQMKSWNITVPQETKDEFLNFREPDLHKLSVSG
ncbi:acid phosphatase-domain-containing protein [Russula brevipes]|nr:acid phosphatase-domain-containing protein [Russula brevipes]